MRSAFIRDSNWRTLAILSIIGLIVMYIETMVAPAIPDFIKDFAIPYNTAPWILTAYLVVAVVMTPVMARLADTHGRKTILVSGLVIYAFATLAAGFATNIYFMVIARSIQGIGLSVFPIAVAIIRNQSSDQRLGFNQGIITSMFATGAVIGLAAGGTIVHFFGWRATFFTVLPVLVLLIILVKRFIHGSDYYNDRSTNSIEGSNFHSKIDIKGAIAFSIGISSFLLMITNLNSQTTSSNLIVIGSLAAIGIISSVIFFYIEKGAKPPLIDLRLVKDGILLSANVLRMMSGLFMFAILNTMPILIRSPKPIGFGESAVNTASVILPFMAAYLIVGLSFGYIMSRIGNTKVTLIGSMVSVLGFTTLVLFFHSEYVLLISLGVLGAGFQLLHQGSININLVSTPEKQTGISFGISNVFYLVGGALGPAIVGMYMQENQIATKGIAGSFPSSESYILIFSTGIILSIISIIVDIVVMKKINNNKNKDRKNASTFGTEFA
ncbi:MAG TPA: MFS transporter [Nitrososphaeraceae archaeon]|nr:MFS transporter [Nitrososphaeraceae archaeon]